MESVGSTIVVDIIIVGIIVVIIVVVFTLFLLCRDGSDCHKAPRAHAQRGSVQLSEDSDFVCP